MPAEDAVEIVSDDSGNAEIFFQQQKRALIFRHVSNPVHDCEKQWLVIMSNNVYTYHDTYLLALGHCKELIYTEHNKKHPDCFIAQLP